jgi:hypothetical protein
VLCRHRCRAGSWICNGVERAIIDNLVIISWAVESAAQRLGPTLPLSGRQGAFSGEAES